MTWEPGKILGWLLLMLLVFFWFASSDAARAETAYETANSRTLYIKTEPLNTSAGGFRAQQSTGFFVTDNGYILTVRHFVGDDAQNTLKSRVLRKRLIKTTGRIGGKGPPLNLEIVALFPDQRVDLVLLRVDDEKAPVSFDYFDVAEAGAIDPGRYAAFGYSDKNEDDFDELKRLAFELQDLCEPAEGICIGQESQKRGYSGSPVVRESDKGVVGMLIISLASSVSEAGLVKFIHLPSIAEIINDLISPERLSRTNVETTRDDTSLSLADLRRESRAQIKRLQTNDFFTDPEFEAGVGLYQSYITEICKVREQERIALGEGGDTELAIQRIRDRAASLRQRLSAGASRLEKLRQLNSMLSTQISLLNSLRKKYKPDNGAPEDSGAPECLVQSVRDLEDFKSIMSLIASWIEQPREPTCASARALIDGVSNRLRERYFFADIPSSTDQCLALSSPLVPTTIAPVDGSRLTSFPRRIDFEWTRVLSARSYVIEIQIQDPVELSWHPHPFGFGRKVITSNTFAFEFVGSQPGRWRVAARSQSGTFGKFSPWAYFDFTPP